MGAAGDARHDLLKELRETLFTAIISDSLDAIGCTAQAVSPAIRPLDEGLVMVGFARTMLYADVYERPAPGENPYELEIALVDSLQPGDVAVCACGASGRIAPWGGLLSTASRVRGAAGTLTDGLVRDIRDIRELGFPVHHGGIGPLDSSGRGKVIAIDVTVECGGVTVRPGDIVFGDADGCVVIPKDRIDEVLGVARHKLRGEFGTRKALLDGRPLADVYAEFGIL